MTVSCNREKGNDPSKKTYFDILMDDYKALVKAYPEAKNNFVEARYVLDGIISETAPGDIRPESVEVYCYTWLEGKSEIFVLERDFTSGGTQMVHYSADSPWLGDKKIPESEMRGLEYSLEDAIENACKDPEASSSDGLETRFVTLRKPLWPVWDNPQYVIGGSSGRSFHVFVDAREGTVKTLEREVEEGSANAFLHEDYSWIIDMFGNSEIMGYRIELRERFVEAQYTLNAPMNAKQASELFPKEVTYLFYAPKASKDGKDILAKGYRDLTAGDRGTVELSMDELDSPWTGDRFISPIILDEVIDIEDAIYNVKISNVTDPDTNKITLRWPDVNPALENPQFVFTGDKTKTVYVDALTGEVQVAE